MFHVEHPSQQTLISVTLAPCPEWSIDPLNRQIQHPIDDVPRGTIYERSKQYINRENPQKDCDLFISRNFYTGQRDLESS